MTVRAMHRAYRHQPGPILAYVGPSIGAERYEVGDEVIEAWQSLPARQQMPFGGSAGVGGSTSKPPTQRS